MKIKTKLTLGIGLLFLIIMLLTAVSSTYINALKNDTENILVANYNTLEYSRNMIMAIDETGNKQDAIKKFQESLIKQQHNITEIGEKEATEKLTQHFNQFVLTPDDHLLQTTIRNDLAEIMRLNMFAIQRKSNIATKTAKDATTWIAISSTICFLISFALLLNLPGNIANPIKELTESIKQIADKNYNQRVHFVTHGEFGELARSFNVMAEKLEEYNNSNLFRLLLEKKRTQALINNMHDPIIGLDDSKKVLFANNEALKISGLKSEEIVGKFAQDVAVTNDLIRLLIRELMEPVQANEKKEPLKIFADNKESYFEKQIVNISVTPTGEKEIKHIGHVIILRNITPFKELDFAKTNFIATVSHELKTPISSIKMSVQLLEKKETGTINDEQKQLITGIKDDSDRLLKITGELLNLSQAETGNIQLNIQKCSPNIILQYALDAIKIQSEQKHIDLKISTDDNLPDVIADAEKTTWVLINLLTNAIRYSPEQSKVLIKIRKENDTVIFSVKDEGRGIDSRYRDKIFDRYFQVPGSSKTGTGLGLAICKEFIEAQGGIIKMESEIGTGSIFTITLNTTTSKSIV